MGANDGYIKFMMIVWLSVTKKAAAGGNPTAGMSPVGASWWLLNHGGWNFMEVGTWRLELSQKSGELSAPSVIRSYKENTKHQAPSVVQPSDFPANVVGTFLTAHAISLTVVNPPISHDSRNAMTRQLSNIVAYYPHLKHHYLSRSPVS